MAPSRDGAVELVLGRHIIEVDGSALRQEASSFDHVVVDLGAGDGRFTYRLLGLTQPEEEDFEDRLARGYAEAGLGVIKVRWQHTDVPTSWSKNCKKTTSTLPHSAH